MSFTAFPEREQNRLLLELACSSMPDGYDGDIPRQGLSSPGLTSGVDPDACVCVCVCACVCNGCCLHGLCEAKSALREPN